MFPNLVPWTPWLLPTEHRERKRSERRSSHEPHLIKTLTLASENHPGGLGLRSEPRDAFRSSDLRARADNFGRTPRLIQWKKESQKSSVPPISRSRQENWQNLPTAP